MQYKILLVGEAAQYIRVSYRTMQRYIADGKIPYTKPAGKILIKEKDLIDFIEMRNRK